MNIKMVLKNNVAECIFSYRHLVKSSFLKKRNCRILMYHSIEDYDSRVDRMGLAVAPRTFYMHMKYLKENAFCVMGLLELVNKISNGSLIPEKSIVITFDDGFKSVKTEALPILKEFGFTATLFVNIYFAERNLPQNVYWHDWPTLDWEQIKQLYEAGLTIGSHGLTHRRLTELNNQDLSKEIAESKELIERKINKEISAFSYPHGAFNNKVRNILMKNNFCCSCSSVEGTNNDSSDTFALRRTQITDFDDTCVKFEKKILGCSDWLRFVRSN